MHTPQEMKVLLLMCCFVHTVAIRVSAQTHASLRAVSEDVAHQMAELHSNRPNLSNIERTGWYAWPLVSNCRASKNNTRDKRVHVKPIGVPWSKLTNWTRKTTSLHENVVDPVLWYFGVFGTGRVSGNISVSFSFGGRLGGKGRFLKNIRLVTRTSCFKKYGLEVTVVQARSFVSEKHTRRLGADGPVVGASIDLQVKALNKYKKKGKKGPYGYPSQIRQLFRLNVFGNGQVDYRVLEG